MSDGVGDGEARPAEAGAADEGRLRREERLERILDLLADRRRVSVAEVCAELGASPATARRDLDHLAEAKLVLRTHGGASSLAAGGFERTVADRAGERTAAKRAVGRAVAALLGLGDAVGLNGGSTTTEVARELARADHLVPADGSTGVTVVTNALNVAYELAVRPHVRVELCGGTVRARSLEITGPPARAFLEELVLDVAVLGVDGVDARFGTTTADAGEADVGRAMAAAARRVVVVADAAKLGAAGPRRLLGLDGVDVLVTDAAPTGELAEALAAAGVEVVVAPSDG
ncbi:DeoR/GlpR family DNA-binding transcription regulator [Quadrisphaera sp. INWT6]|uniref:DeoR/GlpR family DNA-binding transcription regulator n=1 Tax=Quadrisphaera sp. INWT6 TaxID=2596917 RepID=UPI002815CDFD|nr:DeoR/GlpR family DNA-binding transcription regulator [Quadrisphaera sp. INWT6]